MLVKIRISPNEIVILQYIGEEVDYFWVVPVGHAHCRVTWPKIWFQDWKISFLGCFKVASWPVLPRLFFSWKSTQPTGFAKITGVHGETMKRGSEGGWGWSVDHTIITKSRLLLLQQSGFKGRPGKVSLKSCNHCNNGWNKKLIGPTHLTIWPKKQKTVVILKMFPLKPLTCYCRYWSTWPDLTEPWGAPQEAGELGNI